MVDQFLGEIRAVGFNFAPVGWSLCEGQLLPISANAALFSILGTTYGGNGTTTFALPNLKVRVPIHRGQGPGLSIYNVGDAGGQANVTLVGATLPVHSHGMACFSQPAVANSPTNATWAASGAGRTPPPLYAAAPIQTPANMSTNVVGVVGGGGSHNNLSPFVAVYFIIAMQGAYPQRP